MAAWRFNGWTTSASWWNRLMPLSLFRRAGPRTRRASHDRRRLVRARHWTARPARRDRHDAYAGRPRPDRTLAISRAACGRRSPERSGERSRLPTRHVRGGGHRRYARPADPKSANSGAITPIPMRTSDAQRDLLDERLARRIHRGPGRQLRLDDARRGGLSLLHRSDAGACRACDGSTAVRDDAVLGDGRPKSVAGLRHPRVGFGLEAPPEGRVLDNVVGRGGECPARRRRSGRGDRAVAG